LGVWRHVPSGVLLTWRPFSILRVHPQKLRPGHQKTKLVREEQLTTYLNKGWQLTKELRSGKMLIAKAS